MLEINRLYRTIGHREQRLTRPQNPGPASNPCSENSNPENSEPGLPQKTPRPLNPYVGGELLLLAAHVICYRYKKRTQ
jgi:hypothetical protein